MLPEDPVMLMSVVNTKLRDVYASFDALCEDLEVSRDAVVKALAEAGYAYDADRNQFV